MIRTVPIRRSEDKTSDIPPIWPATALDIGQRPDYLAAMSRKQISFSRGPVSIVARLIAPLAVLILLLLVLGGLTLWGIDRSSQDLRRADQSFRQLENVRAVEASFNRYLLRELARRVVSGGDPAESREAGRLRGALLAYRSAIAEEIAFSQSEDERNDERAEMIRANALAALFETIETEAIQDRINPAMFGALDQVRSFLSRSVSGRDEKFLAVLFEIQQDERQEAADALASLDRLRTWLLWFGGGVTGVFLAAIIFYGWLFYRGLLGPIRRLTYAADGFGAGDMEARAPEGLPREFDALAGRFNAMADRISSERTRLEAEVADRTADLANANAELKKIDEARRRFFANVSHELRTPVTVLLGEAQFALRSSGRNGDAGEMKAALQRIAASGGFLRRRLDDLLKLARSEDGQLALTLTEMNFGDSVRQAVDIARAYAAANEVTLDYVAEENLHINGDAEAMRQAALALIDNAIKFSPPASHIKVGVDRTDAVARLYVLDQGPGFATDAPEQLFDRYAQESTGRQSGGSGLGLAIVHWIAEQHGGRLKARNHEGGGAMFELEIPLC